MNWRLYNKKYIALTVLFTAVGCLSLIIPTVIFIKLILAIFYFLGNGFILGDLVLTKENKISKAAIGLLLFVSIIIFVGSVVYFKFDLTSWHCLWILLLAPILGLVIGLLKQSFHPYQPTNFSPTEPIKKQSIITSLFGFLLASGLTALTIYEFNSLNNAATDLSIRSPWDYVPRLFFIIVFLIAAATLSLALGHLVGAVTVIPIMGLTFLIITVALKIYSVGFGFDPFIHQATENHIFNYGAINPKPFYYLGQYALVTTLGRIVNGQISTIDTWLVPIFFCLVIPIIYWSLKRAFDWSSSQAAATSLFLLVFPLSSFITTTPQGLANVFLLITVFLLFASIVSTKFPSWIALMPATATVAIHPLAGAPLLIFTVAIIYLRMSSSKLKHWPKLRWTGFVLLISVAAVALPLLFLINSNLSGATVTLDQETLLSATSLIDGLGGSNIVSRQFSAIMDFVYTWRTWRTLTLLFLTIIGAALLWSCGRQRKNEKWNEAAMAFGAGVTAFGINFILLHNWLRFSFLIENEQTNYADRVIELMLFIGAPLILFAFGSIINKLRSRGSPLLVLGLILLLASIITANVYLNYPRRDKYETSRGWSTSGADFKAVQAINKNAAGTNYVVLANQSVSAAAIHELGFKKYFTPVNGTALTKPIFFYPIPTGDALYKIFLEANNTSGKRATIKKAADLTAAKTIYFVVDHYWWQAQQIIIAAKKESNKWWSIDDKVWIFKYVF